MFAWAYTARLVRGQVLSLREREFVDAARIMGAGWGHILFKQLLPNLWAPILISFALAVPQNITTEAALSYLGRRRRAAEPRLGLAAVGRLPVLPPGPDVHVHPRRPAPDPRPRRSTCSATVCGTPSTRAANRS